MSKENITADELLDKKDILSSIKKYRLSKPVKVADKTISELELDFESLTGDDMERIAGYSGCNSGDANMNEFSKTYQMYVVAAAAKITIHELRKFSIKDTTALSLMAFAFLMSAVSEVINQ